MDAVKFIKEMGRMCKKHLTTTVGTFEYECGDCLFLCEIDGSCYRGDLTEFPEEAVEIVEQWSKEHPAKTYKDDFLEKFPNAKIVNYIGGQAPDFCRNLIYSRGNCEISKGCFDCWNEPMEE